MALRLLRENAGRVVDPLVTFAAFAGITPNAITIASLCVCGLAGVSFALGASLLWMVPAAVVRIIMDVADGVLARRTGASSAYGALLNDISDIFGDALLYGGLALSGAMPPTAATLALVTGILAEAAGIAGAAYTRSARYASPGDKADRLALFALATFSAVEFSVHISAMLLWLCCVFNLLSAFQRLRKALLACGVPVHTRTVV